MAFKINLLIGHLKDYPVAEEAVQEVVLEVVLEAEAGVGVDEEGEEEGDTISFTTNVIV